MLISNGEMKKNDERKFKIKLSNELQRLIQKIGVSNLQLTILG